MPKIKYFFRVVITSLLSISLLACGQPFTDSNLPIVIINTDGNVSIPDQPRVQANMKIIYAGAGQRNYMTDQNNAANLNYNGRIEIEVRGSSSQSLNKKQYGLTTLQSNNASNNNVSLLGMPSENDWVLNGLAFDASLMRDHISYTLSRRIGEYAPRTQYCEVVINGDYRGLYMLQEKVKADDQRVDVVKIDLNDNSLPDLSGGYITKADKVTSEDPSAWIAASYLGSINFIHEMPKPNTITINQHNYIKSQFDKLMVTSNNTSLTNGFPSVIDIPSFLNFMIVNELAANVDAYQFSTFFHKDKNGKLRAGPLWDVNLSYGNDLFLWGLNRSFTNQWQFDNGDNIGAKFWLDLFNNATFKCYLSKRWKELTQPGQPLHLSSIQLLIDETVAIINEAAARDIAKWRSEKENWDTPIELAIQVADMKSFLSTRITWMTSNLGSFASCNNVVTPPLVISRIMYQPGTSSSFPDASDQEFIEIVNNGDNSIDLTGLYFSGTGFVYQFPANTTMPPRGVLHVANDLDTFRELYGFSAFDQFTRNLSNSGQKLRLVDGFGNIIDEVEYSSQSPWPNAAGNGFSLKLNNLSADNSLATSWTASNESIEAGVVGIEEELNDEVTLYPNPTDNLFQVTSSARIVQIQLSDSQGRVMETFQPGTNSTSISLKNFTTGIYMLTIATNGKMLVKKIVKK